jgi:hypothetical protein
MHNRNETLLLLASCTPSPSGTFYTCLPTFLLCPHPPAHPQCPAPLCRAKDVGRYVGRGRQIAKSTALHAAMRACMQAPCRPAARPPRPAQPQADIPWLVWMALSDGTICLEDACELRCGCAGGCFGGPSRHMAVLDCHVLLCLVYCLGFVFSRWVDAYPSVCGGGCRSV